jgi:hypothetical protein
MYRSILFLLISILILSGCKEDSSTSSIIGNNLFPLTAGNKFEYTQYDVDSSYVKVPGTERKFTREIGSPVYVAGRYASPLFETTYNSSNAVESRDTTYVWRSATDDTISYYVKISVPLTSSTNLVLFKWIPMFIRSAGVGAEFTVIDTTITAYTSFNGTDYPVPLTVLIKNYIYNQGVISVPDKTEGYTSNQIDLYYILSEAGVMLRQGTYYQLWLADGVGPVKERRVLLEKNVGRTIDLTSKTIK